MKDHELYEAIGEIREEYVADAASGRKKRPAWIRWGAAAACLCVVLIGATLGKTLLMGSESEAGCLTITAYAASSGMEETMPMEEGMELPLDYRWSPYMSSIPGLPLQLSYTGDREVTFEVSTDGGTFLLWTDSQITDAGSAFQAGNNTTLYWSSFTQYTDPKTGEVSLEEFTGEQAYVEILILQGDAVVGYAVVEITMDEGELPMYSAALRKVELFSEQQREMTREEAAAAMEQAKEAAR